ncbi:hypothetical protein AB0D38_25875 [Streptomyces sp. NPDC048279]
MGGRAAGRGDRLTPAQQWLLESVGIEPPAKAEPVAGAPRSQVAGPLSLL